MQIYIYTHTHIYLYINTSHHVSAPLNINFVRTYVDAYFFTQQVHAHANTHTYTRTRTHILAENAGVR